MFRKRYIASLAVLSIASALTYIASAQNEPRQAISADPQDWPMYNHDSIGTRQNSGETVLSAATVPNLHVKWRIFTEGDVYATPAVVNNIVYFGDSSGTFYALTSNGVRVWTVKPGGPITASALVTDTIIVIGDQLGTIFGLDRATGRTLWQVHPNRNSGSIIWGSATLVEGKVIIGIGSDESDATKAPGFSGSVVSIDPNNGNLLWQTYVISPQEQDAGSSGAGIWSTPTYDPGTGLVYVSTGNSYTAPASSSSDAVIALDPATGDIQWTYQATAADIGNIDADFGDSPHVYSLDGRDVIGIGQKSGRFLVLDAATGALIQSLQVVPYCKGTNGLFATAAVAGSKIFAPGQNCSYPSGTTLPPPTGQLTAIKSDGAGTSWHNVTLFANAMSGAAVANGVVYYSVVGLYGNLLALDAQTGKTLANVFIGWGSSGPSISRGQVYLGTGTKFASGVYTPPSLVALGL
jgi:polyvinyl alcohol dehydrogenase (cytochrome)